MSDIVKILGRNIRTVLAFELTMKGERFFRGTARDILQIAEQKL